MELDDLNEMHIPKLCAIEVEADAECFPPRTRKNLGYFRCIEDGQPARLTYYHSPDGPNQIPERYSYESIARIRRVSMLSPISILVSKVSQ